MTWEGVGVRRAIPVGPEASSAERPLNGARAMRSAPQRFVETWIEATWAEHLRNHDRVSVAHKELEQRARDLTRSGSTISTSHFIAPETRPSAAAMVRVVEERTRG